MNQELILKESVRQIRRVIRLCLSRPDDTICDQIADCLAESLSVIGCKTAEFYPQKSAFVKDLPAFFDRLGQLTLLHEEYDGTAFSETLCMVYGQLWLERKPVADTALPAGQLNPRFTILCRRTDGACQITHLHLSLPFSRQEEALPLRVSNTTQLSAMKEYSQYLEKLLELDAMTRLYNRIAIESKVDSFLQTHPENYAFYMMDVDNFKTINDTCGHPFGDRILLDISAILQQIFSDHSYIGRAGGDEFIVFLTEIVSDEEITRRARQIMDRCSALAARHRCPVSCSVGIVLSDEQRCSFSRLYAAADKALYKSKMSGKANYVFSPAPEHRRRSPDA